MKCVKIKDVKQFEIGDIPEPKGNGNVVIDVRKTGICGSDLHYWVSGEPKGLVMGHEFCGTVKDPGTRSDLKVGDRVTALPISPCGKCEACTTGNVQYCKHTWEQAVGLSLTSPGALAPVTSARPDMVIKVPDNISDEEVAMVEPTAVGLHAVDIADIEIGDKVLVIGGGIIGLVSAMFAKKAGASLVAVSETNEKRGEKAVSLGVADVWYDARKPETMADKEFDKVIECCGNDKAVSNSLMMVKAGGTVVLVGVSLTPINVPTIVAVMKELKVLGAIAYTKEEFEKCIDLISKGLNVKRFVDDIVTLDGVQEAYERLTSGTDSAVKILVDPNK